jgi:hypothetical protein
MIQLRPPIGKIILEKFMTIQCQEESDFVILILWLVDKIMVYH